MNHKNRDLALSVGCEYCHATPGEPCRNLRTNQPLQNAPAHTCRTKLAESEVPF